MKEILKLLQSIIPDLTREQLARAITGSPERPIPERPIPERSIIYNSSDNEGKCKIIFVYPDGQQKIKVLEQYKFENEKQIKSYTPKGYKCIKLQSSMDNIVVRLFLEKIKTIILKYPDGKLETIYPDEPYQDCFTSIDKLLEYLPPIPGYVVKKINFEKYEHIVLLKKSENVLKEIKIETVKNLASELSDINVSESYSKELNTIKNIVLIDPKKHEGEIKEVGFSLSTNEKNRTALINFFDKVNKGYISKIIKNIKLNAEYNKINNEYKNLKNKLIKVHGEISKFIVAMNSQKNFKLIQELLKIENLQEQLEKIINNKEIINYFVNEIKPIFDNIDSSIKENDKFKTSYKGFESAINLKNICNIEEKEYLKLIVLSIRNLLQALPDVYNDVNSQFIEKSKERQRYYNELVSLLKNLHQKLKQVVAVESERNLKKVYNYIYMVVKLEYQYLLEKYKKDAKFNTTPSLDLSSFIGLEEGTFYGNAGVEKINYKYQSVSENAIFNGSFSEWKPNFCDIEQGDIGDCYLLASLIGLIKHDHVDAIKKCFLNGETLDKDSYVKIRLFKLNLKKEMDTVTNSETLIARPNGKVIIKIDKSILKNGDFNAYNKGSIWVSFFEKAFAIYRNNGENVVSNDGTAKSEVDQWNKKRQPKLSSENIDGGNGYIVLTAISGNEYIGKNFFNVSTLKKNTKLSSMKRALKGYFSKKPPNNEPISDKNINKDNSQSVSHFSTQLSANLNKEEYTQRELSIFKHIKKQIEELHSPVVVSTKDKKANKDNTPLFKEDKAPPIYSNHAYAVDSVEESNDLKYIILRNPHGGGKYEYGWMKNTRKNRLEPKLVNVKTIKETPENEKGIIKIELKHFLKYFNSDDYGKINKSSS